jgi:hypothetical protein
MKEEAFVLAKNEVDAIAAKIAVEPEINLKIELAKGSFWRLNYKTIVNRAEYFTADMENLFMVTEHQIFEGLEKIVVRALEHLGNIVNEDRSDALDTAFIKNCLNNIHCFCAVFDEKRQIVHENRKYE